MQTLQKNNLNRTFTIAVLECSKTVFIENTLSNVFYYIRIPFTYSTIYIPQPLLKCDFRIIQNKLFDVDFVLPLPWCDFRLIQNFFQKIRNFASPLLWYNFRLIQNVKSCTSVSYYTRCSTLADFQELFSLRNRTVTRPTKITSSITDLRKNVYSFLTYSQLLISFWLHRHNHDFLIYCL